MGSAAWPSTLEPVTLLLPAGLIPDARRRWTAGQTLRRAALCALGIVAAFTLGHIFACRETGVGLGFGLIHGLGFASALDGLGVDGLSLTLSVLGFNLGVEAMCLHAAEHPTVPAGGARSGYHGIVCGAAVAEPARVWLQDADFTRLGALPTPH